jgi:plastocyanin
MKKIIATTMLLGGTLFLAGCGSQSPNQNNMPAVTNPAPANNNTGQPSQAQGQMISIQNFSFNPGTLTISKGTTVTWVNNDSVAHNIKSDTFNSSDLTKGQTFSFTFNQTGTFNYSCGIHPSMLGKIIVQ